MNPLWQSMWRLLVIIVVVDPNDDIMMITVLLCVPISFTRIQMSDRFDMK